MNTCFEVAVFFLKRQDTEAGDLMSNMKLQKMVYYAQGFHLAIKDVPLFLEPIEAWDHGPVCPLLYQKYKVHESDMIPIPYEEEAYYIFDDEIREILEMVHLYYGQFSAWKLRNLTHEEAPWINAHKKGRAVITHKDMKEYFKAQLKEE